MYDRYASSIMKKTHTNQITETHTPKNVESDPRKSSASSLIFQDTQQLTINNNNSLMTLKDEERQIIKYHIDK